MEGNVGEDEVKTEVFEKEEDTNGYQTRLELQSHSVALWQLNLEAKTQTGVSTEIIS